LLPPRLQRLRDIINKGLTNEELLRGVKTAWDKGWRQIKLYFMIGEGARGWRWVEEGVCRTTRP
jgi:hypothetical protein